MCSFPCCTLLNYICQFTDHACDVHEFRCEDGACIRTKFVCDGHEDCIDGLDEKDCSMYLTFYIFLFFPSRSSFCEYKLLFFPLLSVSLLSSISLSLFVILSLHIPISGIPPPFVIYWHTRPFAFNSSLLFWVSIHYIQCFL